MHKISHLTRVTVKMEGRKLSLAFTSDASSKANTVFYFTAKTALT